MKNKILSIVICVFLFSFFMINVISKDGDISYTERRKLAKLPEFSIEDLFNGEYFGGFENYTLDQFAFRDEFRSLKAFFQFNIFGKKDNNKIFYENGHIFEHKYKLDEDSVKFFNLKMKLLYNNYLNKEGVNVYLSVIPEKNYYLESDTYIKYDYDKLINQVKDGLSNMTYIDITDTLTLDDYYSTDTHWKQENLEKVVEKFSNAMNFEYSKFDEYTVNEYGPFYGVYYGQLSLKVQADKIKYLTNDIINNAIVRDTESDLSTVYETSSLGAMDSYDVYLSGATGLVQMINPLAKTDKELVIFRDSFGSSIAPLFLKGYSKVTLVDLRYTTSSIVEEIQNLSNADVLILYSTLVINNSSIIKG